MEITPIYKRVIGLDVHQAKISACAVAEQPDGTLTVEQREFGAFKRDRRALAEWAREFAPEVVVMESTGIYWKSPYAALEGVGIAAWVVNARHVKNVPGRKTDVADALWLATLARAGLLRQSFIPPADIRYLRLIARQRQKLGGMLASEKNRLHKLLADAGIRVSLFIDPDPSTINAARDLGVPAIELHTGRYAHTWREGGEALEHLRSAAVFARQLGLAVHAGHGLTYLNVEPVAAIEEIEELNIGHSIVSRAVMTGMVEAVAEMGRRIAAARRLP